MPGAASAKTIVRGPAVTDLLPETGVRTIVAEEAAVFAGGAVKRTVAMPFESVVTSVALSVPMVVLTVNRCPATPFSSSSRTKSCTSDVDRPSRGNVSGDAVEMTDTLIAAGVLLFRPFAERPCSREQPLATTARASGTQQET